MSKHWTTITKARSTIYIELKLISFVRNEQNALSPDNFYLQFVLEKLHSLILIAVKFVALIIFFLV